MQQFRNRAITGLKRLRAGEQGKWIRVNPQNTLQGMRRASWRFLTY